MTDAAGALFWLAFFALLLWTWVSVLRELRDRRRAELDAYRAVADPQSPEQRWPGGGY